MSASEPRRGRRRDAGIDTAVTSAVVDALQRQSFTQLAVSDIAQSAGVSRNAIYRRWTTKAEMVVDAVTSTITSEPIRDCGSLRDDLIELTRLNVALFQGDGRHLFIAGMAAAAEIGTAFGGISQPRKRQIAAVFERAEHRGELPPGIDPIVATKLLTGGALFSTVFLGEQLDTADIERMVDTVLTSHVVPNATHPV